MRLYRNEQGGFSCPAEGIYVMRTHVRIEWWGRLGLGWPELSPAMTSAVAGARVSSGLRLRRTSRPVRGIYRAT